MCIESIHPLLPSTPSPRAGQTGRPTDRPTDRRTESGTLCRCKQQKRRKKKESTHTTHTNTYIHTYIHSQQQGAVLLLFLFFHHLSLLSSLCSFSSLPSQPTFLFVRIDRLAPKLRACSLPPSGEWRIDNGKHNSRRLADLGRVVVVLCYRPTRLAGQIDWLGRWPFRTLCPPFRGRKVPAWTIPEHLSSVPVVVLQPHCLLHPLYVRNKRSQQ